MTTCSSLVLLLWKALGRKLWVCAVLARDAGICLHKSASSCAHVPELCRKHQAWCSLLPGSCFQGPGGLEPGSDPGYQRMKLCGLLWQELVEGAERAREACKWAVCPCPKFLYPPSMDTGTWSEWLVRCQEFWIPRIPKSILQPSKVPWRGLRKKGIRVLSSRLDRYRPHVPAEPCRLWHMWNMHFWWDFSLLLAVLSKTFHRAGRTQG